MFIGEVLKLKSPEYRLQEVGPTYTILPCGRCGKNVVREKFVGVKVRGTQNDPEYVCTDCLEEI